jgi:hypothetical protein
MPVFTSTLHQHRYTHPQPNTDFGEATFLHQTHAHQLMTFITEGKVAFRPLDFDIILPIPPDPD